MYYDTTFGIGAIVANIEIKFKVSKSYAATWHEPPEMGQLEILSVTVLSVTGATYEMDRCEFPSWAEILDNLIWDQIDDGELDHLLYSHAEEY